MLLNSSASVRGRFQVEGVTRPAPAPRFSRTPPATPGAASPIGADTFAVLVDWGFSEEQLPELEAQEAIMPRSGQE